jgi:cyclophilin family peptidyl-prolyl cis-trans isomerase
MQGGVVLAMQSIHRSIGARALAIATAVLLSTSGCNKSDTELPTANIAGSATNSESGSSPFPQKPAVNIHPTVKVKTTVGEFTIKLNADLAPLSVDSFLAYANSGFYNGTIVHQVIPGFIALAGGYDTKYQLKPTESPVRNEAHKGMQNKRGTVALARQPDAVDSANSQFFINLADNASLDYTGDDPEQYGYCAFGEVVDGMDVIDKIAKCQVGNMGQMQNVPTQQIVIQSIDVLR